MSAVAQASASAQVRATTMTEAGEATSGGPRLGRRAPRRHATRPARSAGAPHASLERHAHAFLARPGPLLSKAQLEEKLYAFVAEVESNTIEVHVSRLRKKLGSAVIKTDRGMGCRLGKP